jgi:hypothetical protein
MPLQTYASITVLRSLNADIGIRPNNRTIREKLNHEHNTYLELEWSLVTPIDDICSNRSDIRSLLWGRKLRDEARSQSRCDLGIDLQSL